MHARGVGFNGAGYPPPMLKTELSRERGGIPVVSASGEAGCLVLDLRGVGFMDVSGLNALIRAQGALHESVPQGFVAVACGAQVRPRQTQRLENINDSFVRWRTARITCTTYQESMRRAHMGHIARLFKISAG